MKGGSQFLLALVSDWRVGILMKTFRSIKIILGVTLAVIYFSCVIIAEGQTGREASSSEAGCTKKYDRFRNRNTVMVEPRTIYRAGTDELKLGASAVVEGDQGAAPREVDLLFDSTTSRLRYGNSAVVRFIVDGKRIEGSTAYKMGGEAMRQVNEKLRLTIPASRFLEVLGGREVEMQIGETEVTLRREDLQRLRDFATCAGLRATQ
jgi:hypothetical protein